MMIESVKSFAANDVTSAKQTVQLRQGAREVEAMMLGEMLKPLQFGGAPGEDEQQSGGANDTIRGFGTEALTKAIAQGGGFGIAQQIVRQVTAERERTTGKRDDTKV